MSSHGIVHRSSCTYTPQQNGEAKRKNRHLVETARTLLLHHKVPQRILGDAILAACYLINHMSSSVLHDQILQSILFLNQPLYCLFPRVFGCVCFVHILTPGQNKLSAKATKCVYPSYSRLQRGFRSYSPDIQRYFIYADITFFENSSMFPTTHSPNSDVISLPLLYPLQVISSIPPVDSSPMAPSSPTPVLSSPANHFIVVRKGTPSSCNLHLIYNFLTYHRLSSPYQPSFGITQSTSDHSVFYPHTSLRECIYLIVYMDDIVITDSDQDGIWKLKQHLFNHFQTKDLEKLKYFLEIKIAQSNSNVVMSQRKYVLDILEEIGMLDCKPVDTPMDPNVKLVLGQREPLRDPRRYRRLVGKLNYLTITQPNISFLVSVISQFL